MDRQEVINIFAQEMAKTQKKADKFYYKQNDKDMAAYQLYSYVLNKIGIHYKRFSC